MIYLYLFWEFFQTGLFAFGGGLATLPFLSNMAARYGWFTQAELTNMLAVSEATPGPIGVNMATYCGMKTAGVPGACIATFGLVLPSILCMLLLASLLARYQESRTVRGALQVLRPVSVGLVAAAGWAVVQAALFPGGLWAVSWLAAALFGIPAVRGVSFGDGFAAAGMRGSQHNDPFMTDGKTVSTRTNHAGGVNGGITNGMPVTFEATIRPTPSIALPQESVDLRTGEETEIEIHGRHDPCIVPRAVPVIEAAAALAACAVLGI